MKKETVTVFMLAMINVAAVGSLRSWPSIAEYGFSAIFFLILAALIFFIPVSLVSAELATAWPKLGGIYAWVKEAFGHRTGFLAIWLLWMENVIYYPALLSFISAMVAYIIDPTFQGHGPFVFFTSLLIFWLATICNLLGMRVSAWISSLGVICGNFLPAAIIILFGILWVATGNPIQIDMSFASFVPDMSSIYQLVLFSAVLLSYGGMEMSSVHAKDVINPQKNYPKAILISGLIIIGLAISGVLSVAVVVPQSEISLTGGIMQAFTYFMQAQGLGMLIPFIAFLIFIGAVAGLNTWILGPTKGLLAAAQTGDLPPFFRKVNRNGMPLSLLITQACVVSILLLLFIFMPSINSAYWLISALIIEIYLIMYIIMFLAAIKLRYKRPDVPRPFKIPGGMFGIWLVAGVGLLSSFGTFIIGFLPPAQIPTGNSFFYIGFLLTAVAFISLLPYLILLFKKPSWNKRLAHEAE